MSDLLARIGGARPALEHDRSTRTETWVYRSKKRRLVRVFEGGELVKVERFWRDGTRRVLGHVKQGRADGEWFFVRRDGSLDRARTGLYRDGRWIGGIRGFNDWLGSA